MSTLHNSGKQPGWKIFSRKIFGILTAWLSAAVAPPTSAYDNSKFPPFDTATAGRGFQNISIHPNGEEWLISECSNVFTGYRTCYLLIYNLKDRTYKRLDLPKDFSYLDGRFSPSGEKILMIRRPMSKTGEQSDVMKNYARGQIALMNRDGSEFRVLPIPVNRIIGPAMSPDESKVAYLVAGSDNPPVRWINFSDFEIWEFDLLSDKNQLFAGPLNFFHATTINYLSDSEILAGAFAPENTGSNEPRDYFNQYKKSEIFRIKRGMHYAPEPSFYDLEFARLPSIDQHKNVFYDAQAPKIGASLVKKDPDGNTTIWREPRMKLCSLIQIEAARSGNYVGFIYGGDPIKSKAGMYALGYFDIGNESWNPVLLPQINEAMPTPPIETP